MDDFVNALHAYDQLRDNLERFRVAWTTMPLRHSRRSASAAAPGGGVLPEVPFTLQHGLLADAPFTLPSFDQLRRWKEDPALANTIQTWLDTAAPITLQDRRDALQSWQPQLVAFVRHEPPDDLDLLHHNLQRWHTRLVDLDSPRLATAELLPSCWTLRFWSQSTLWDDPTVLQQVASQSDTWNHAFQDAVDEALATLTPVPAAPEQHQQQQQPQPLWPWTLHRRRAVWRAAQDRDFQDDAETSLMGRVLPVSPTEEQQQQRRHLPPAFVHLTDRLREYQRQWESAPLPTARTHPQLTAHSDPWTPQTWVWPLTPRSTALSWIASVRVFLQCPQLPDLLSESLATALRFQWRCITDSAGRPWLHYVMDAVRDRLPTLDTQGDARTVPLLEYMRAQLALTSHYQALDLDDEDPYLPYCLQRAEQGLLLQWVAETGRGDPAWIPCADVDTLDRHALHGWLLSTTLTRAVSTAPLPERTTVLRTRQSAHSDLDRWVRAQSFHLPASIRQPTDLQARPLVLASPPTSDLEQWTAADEHHLPDDQWLQTTRWVAVPEEERVAIVRETLEHAATHLDVATWARPPTTPAGSRAPAWLRREMDRSATDDRWMGPAQTLEPLWLSALEQECVAWTLLHQRGPAPVVASVVPASVAPRASVPTIPFVYVDQGEYQPAELLPRPVLLQLVWQARRSTASIPVSSAEWQTTNHWWFYLWNVATPLPVLESLATPADLAAARALVETSSHAFHARWMRFADRFVAAVLATERNMIELELVRMVSWVPPEYFHQFQQRHQWTEVDWRRWVSDWAAVRPYLLADLTGYVRALATPGPREYHDQVYREWHAAETRLVEARLADARWHTATMDFFRTLYPMRMHPESCWHVWVQSMLAGRALEPRQWWRYAREAPVSQRQPVGVPARWLELCVYAQRMRQAWDMLCRSVPLTAERVGERLPRVQAMAGLEAFVSATDGWVPEELRQQLALETLWTFAPDTPVWDVLRAAQILADAYNRMQAVERQWLRQCRWEDEDALVSWMATLHVLALADDRRMLPSTNDTSERTDRPVSAETAFGRAWAFAGNPTSDHSSTGPARAYEAFRRKWTWA